MLPTTAAVLEIFIVGIQALVWVLLLALAIAPSHVRLAEVAESQALTIGVAGLLAYALGVVVDRVADTFYTWVREETRAGQILLQGWLGKPPKAMILPAFSVMRLRIMGLDDGRARFLEYQRSRLRIARSTVFNLLLALPSSLWYLIARTDMGTAAVAGTELLLLALLVLSVLSAERIGDAYHGRLADAYRMWQNEDEKLAGKERESFGESIRPGCRRYAAVPYRTSERSEPRGLEFLIVRTSGGAYWTFPKGSKDSEDEEGWKAAAREAEEEAGVTGDPERDAFYSYPYPALGDEKCEEYLVKAYLLPVTGEVERSGDDARRELLWDTAENVSKLLAEGRKKRYAEAHAALVAAALNAVQAMDGAAGAAPKQ